MILVVLTYLFIQLVFASVIWLMVKDKRKQYVLLALSVIVAFILTALIWQVKIPIKSIIDYF